MLINGCEGVLSIGGTAAPAIELVVGQTQHELDRLGMVERGEAWTDEVADPTVSVMPLPAERPDIDETKRLAKSGRKPKDVIPRQASWEDTWAWSRVQGAEGWWQILMQSVYVDGVKVLQNQAVVIDVRLPSFGIFDRAQALTRSTDQQPFHNGTTNCSQSLLCLCLRLPASSTAIRQFLRLPLP